MSPSIEERRTAWAEWCGTHTPPNSRLHLGGFEHESCGAPTLVPIGRDLGTLTCSGCRTEVSPIRDGLFPLYVLAPPEVEEPPTWPGPLRPGRRHRLPDEEVDGWQRRAHATQPDG